MNWTTVIWSMAASASLTFALLHLLLWVKGIKRAANLSFAATALAIAAITGIELMIMQAASIEHVSMLLRWVHLPLLFLWLGIICFVHYYFDAGRSWLAWTGGCLRILALILSFTTGQNLFFNEITGLKSTVIFGGETVSIPQGTLNPWYIVGPISTLILVAFVLDAAVTMWRRGTYTSRRRAVLFSGSIAFFLLAAVTHNALVNLDVIDLPYVVSFYFVPILAAMSFELSYNMLLSVQLSDRLQANEAELRVSEERISLAASAAELRLWEWDIVHDEIWSTEKNHTLYGIEDSQKISFDRFLNVIHEEDREQIRRLVAESLIKGNGHYESEYRIKMQDGRIHWFNSRGRIEFSESGQPLRMLGVTIDITRQKQAELEVQRQRNEMSHLARVSLLGELSGSLAHELNQPLAAILCNAQAAQRFLAKDKVDLTELRCIIDDIIAEDGRAGDIIYRLRLLFKKEDTQRSPLDVNKLVRDALKLLSSDLVNHNIAVNVELDSKLPAVFGDRVQLQQVLINLILNACEAMSKTEAKKRIIDIRTELTGMNNIEVSVSDKGPGIPTDNMQNIFEPFFTTKLEGMGLGLSICRTIIASHRGQLRADNNIDGGAVFHFTLPVSTGENT